jgi:CrcB protein
MQQGEFLKGMINILLNVSLCIFAAGIGLYLVTYATK